MIEIFDDIRKIYQFGAPCGKLSDHIEFFSESSVENSALSIGKECFTVKMFPSWTPTFWINLGTPYQLSMGSDRFFVRRGEDVLVLRDSTAVRHNLPQDHIFTVKFFPGGLDAILGLQQAKMAGQAISLSSVLPGSLIRRVKTARGFKERRDIFQDFFLAHYKKKKNRDHYSQFVQDTIDLYGSANMGWNNSELAEKMFTSSKTINRYFRKVIGTTPKHYFSIIKARASLTAYVADRRHFEPCDFGYYDMSHFYKAVVKFTGQKLGAHIG